MAALIYADRVKETTVTSGTGTYSLLGAQQGFQTFVAGIATGNTCHYVATNGIDWEIGLGTITAGSPDTLARTVIFTSSNAGAAVVWGSDTKTIACARIAHQRAFPEGHDTQRLSVDYTNSTVTGTKLTALSFVGVQPGDFVVEWWLLVQAGATTTGWKFGVNFTGTGTLLTANMTYPSTGTTQATGVGASAVANNTGSLLEAMATLTMSTTAPNLGPTAGVDVINANIFVKVSAMFNITVAGDIELWGASEVAALMTVKTNSMGLLRQVN